MKILNLHGFLGRADNKNYFALSEFIPQSDIISPKLNYKKDPPDDILRTLSDMVAESNMILVGQSLGGWFADCLSRKFSLPCVLTNPCYYPGKTDLIAGSGIPESFVRQYTDLSHETKNKFSYVLCSDNDTLLPGNFYDCEKLAGYVKKVKGSHSTVKNLKDELIDVFGMLARS